MNDDQTLRSVYDITSTSTQLWFFRERKNDDNLFSASYANPRDRCQSGVWVSGGIFDIFLTPISICLATSMVLILHEALYMPSSSTNHIYQLDCRATNMVLVLTETWQFLGNFSPSFETHFLTCMCVMLSRVGDLIWSICFLRPKGKHCSDTLARVNWIITSSQASQMRMTVLFFAGIIQEFL